MMTNRAASSSSSSRWDLLLVAAGAGAAATLLLQRVWWKQKRQRGARQHAGASIEGCDMSLFYDDESVLTTIADTARYLPNTLYGDLVRHTVICCVDVLLIRSDSNNNQQCLLVERSQEPAKGIFWLPGGRLLKGETFFAAALRKARQETGLGPNLLRPVQVLGVWNTFFPRSSWDNASVQGTQTVNAIVLTELVDEQDGDDDAGTTANGQIQLDAQSRSYQWMDVNADAAERDGVDAYVVQALRRYEAWQRPYG